MENFAGKPSFPTSAGSPNHLTALLAYPLHHRLPAASQQEVGGKEMRGGGGEPQVNYPHLLDLAGSGGE